MNRLADTDPDIKDTPTIRAMMEFASEQGIDFKMGPDNALALVLRVESAESRVKELEGILQAVIDHCGIQKFGDSERYKDVLDVLKDHSYPYTEAEYNEALAVVDRIICTPEESWSDQDRTDLEAATDLVEAFEDVHYQITPRVPHE